jgi:hypothetical protein
MNVLWEEISAIMAPVKIQLDHLNAAAIAVTKESTVLMIWMNA